MRICSPTPITKIILCCKLLKFQLIWFTQLIAHNLLAGRYATNIIQMVFRFEETVECIPNHKIIFAHQFWICTRFPSIAISFEFQCCPTILFIQCDKAPSCLYAVRSVVELGARTSKVRAAFNYRLQIHFTNNNRVTAGDAGVWVCGWFCLQLVNVLGKVSGKRV